MHLFYVHGNRRWDGEEAGAAVGLFQVFFVDFYSVTRNLQFCTGWKVGERGVEQIFARKHRGTRTICKH